MIAEDGYNEWWVLRRGEAQPTEVRSDDDKRAAEIQNHVASGEHDRCSVVCTFGDS